MTAETTALAQGQFQTIELPLIARSLTNPRKHFDIAKLQELADSIAASGVHQPVLVRPLPGHRHADTFGNRVEGDPLPTFELVAGERRYRASQLAGVPTIPAIVRDLTDAQVIEIQIIENLQRDGLTPLEEAEGYDALIQATGITKEELCAKVGKSRTYIFNRFKLLDLCQEAKAALREGQLDASRAELIARIPDTTLQLRALKEFTDTSYTGDQRMGFRACQAWIKANVMLRLDRAPFALDDEALCPQAGACATCPKRTGANPDLFHDADSPDICTDPTCYHDKEAALITVELAARRKKGQQIIEDEDDLDDYSALDMFVHGLGEPTTVADLMAKHMTKAERKAATVAGVVNGEVMDLVSDTVIATLRAKARGETGTPTAQAKSEHGTGVSYQLERQRNKLEDDYARAWRTRCALALKPALLGGVIDRFHEPVMRQLLQILVDGSDWPQIALTFGLDADTPKDEDVQTAMRALPPEALGPHILLMLAADEAETVRAWRDHDRVITPTPILEHLAQACNIDAKAIQAEVQQEMRAELTKAVLLNDPAAQPTPLPPAAAASPAKGKKKGAKLSAEEAQRGIAAAMQGQEAAASCGAAEGGQQVDAVAGAEA